MLCTIPCTISSTQRCESFINLHPQPSPTSPTNITKITHQEVLALGSLPLRAIQQAVLAGLQQTNHILQGALLQRVELRFRFWGLWGIVLVSGMGVW